MEEGGAMKKRYLALLLLAGAGAAGAYYMRFRKEWRIPGCGKVELREEQPNPLTSMLSEMVKALLKDPAKKEIADRMCLSVAIKDIDHPEMASTLIFRGSDVLVCNGVNPDADVKVETELGLLLNLASLGNISRLPQFLRSEEGRKLLEAVKAGRFRVKGLVRKPLELLEFQRFLTPAQG